ncbi:MAG: antitoxin [Chloroflexota bacterium]
MKNLTIQPDEVELLVSYEQEEWQSVKNVQEQIGQYQEFARAALKKDKRINIRMSEMDLYNLQKRANREGIPYQTLISSILHKYLNGSLVEK